MAIVLVFPSLSEKETSLRSASVLSVFERVGTKIPNLLNRV